MGKPLEMRGWAVKRTYPDREPTFHDIIYPTRARARSTAIRWAQHATKGYSYTVVPVVVRERR